MVADRMRSTCAKTCPRWPVSGFVTIKKSKTKDYISNMGRPDIARIKRDATLPPQRRSRHGIRRAQAMRESRSQGEGRSGARRGRNASMAKQSDAQRELGQDKRWYMEGIKKQQAQADKAYQFRRTSCSKQVVRRVRRVQQIEKQEQVKVQEAEICAARRADPTVLKQAGDRSSTDRDLANARAQV